MELTQFPGKILDFSQSTTVYKYVKKNQTEFEKNTVQQICVIYLLCIAVVLGAGNTIKTNIVSALFQLHSMAGCSL